MQKVTRGLRTAIEEAAAELRPVDAEAFQVKVNRLRDHRARGSLKINDSDALGGGVRYSFYCPDLNGWCHLGEF
jgi:hypothetical protein